jgi:hypothetical protein
MLLLLICPIAAIGTVNLYSATFLGPRRTSVYAKQAWLASVCSSL